MHVLKLQAIAGFEYMSRVPELALACLDLELCNRSAVQLDVFRSVGLDVR